MSSRRSQRSQWAQVGSVFAAAAGTLVGTSMTVQGTVNNLTLEAVGLLPGGDVVSAVLERGSPLFGSGKYSSLYGAGHALTDASEAMMRRSQK